MPCSPGPERSEQLSISDAAPLACGKSVAAGQVRCPSRPTAGLSRRKDVLGDAASPTVPLWTVSDQTSFMRSIAPILNHLKALGFPEDRALACLGIERAALSDPDARLDYRSLERLWQGAIDTTGDPSLPLRAAQRVQAGDFGVLTYIAAASRDSRAAFQTLRELLPLMSTLADIDLDDTNERPILRVHWKPAFEISIPTREYAVWNDHPSESSTRAALLGPGGGVFRLPPA